MKIQFHPRPNAAWFGREPVEVTMASMFHSVRRTLVFFLLLLAAAPLHAQQTGAIRGKVTSADGAVLPGATIQARSDVLPQPRETVSGAGGGDRLRAGAAGREP